MVIERIVINPSQHLLPGIGEIEYIYDRTSKVMKIKVATVLVHVAKNEAAMAIKQLLNDD